MMVSNRVPRVGTPTVGASSSKLVSISRSWAVVSVPNLPLSRSSSMRFAVRVSRVSSTALMRFALFPVARWVAASQSSAGRKIPVAKYKLVPYPTAICTGYVPSFSLRLMSKRSFDFAI